MRTKGYSLGTQLLATDIPRSSAKAKAKAKAQGSLNHRVAEGLTGSLHTELLREQETHFHWAQP